MESKYECFKCGGGMDKPVCICIECASKIEEPAPSASTNTAQVAIALMKRLDGADILNCDDKEAYNVLEDILSEWHSATVNHA